MSSFFSRLKRNTNNSGNGPKKSDGIDTSPGTTAQPTSAADSHHSSTHHSSAAASSNPTYNFQPGSRQGSKSSKHGQSRGHDRETVSRSSGSKHTQHDRAEKSSSKRTQQTDIDSITAATTGYYHDQQQQAAQAEQTTNKRNSVSSVATAATDGSYWTEMRDWLQEHLHACPVPVGWELRNGFYMSEYTGSLSTEHPMKASFDIVWNALVKDSTSSPELTGESLLEYRETLVQELENIDLIWAGPFTDDNTGKQYYCNQQTRLSIWDNPYKSGQYILDRVNDLLLHSFGIAADQYQRFDDDSFLQEDDGTGVVYDHNTGQYINSNAFSAAYGDRYYNEHYGGGATSRSTRNRRGSRTSTTSSTGFRMDEDGNVIMDAAGVSDDLGLSDNEYDGRGRNYGGYGGGNNQYLAGSYGPAAYSQYYDQYGNYYGGYNENQAAVEGFDSSDDDGGAHGAHGAQHRNQQQYNQSYEEDDDFGLDDSSPDDFALEDQPHRRRSLRMGKSKDTTSGKRKAANGGYKPSRHSIQNAISAMSDDSGSPDRMNQSLFDIIPERIYGKDDVGAKKDGEEDGDAAAAGKGSSKKGPSKGPGKGPGKGPKGPAKGPGKGSNAGENADAAKDASKETGVSEKAADTPAKGPKGPAKGGKGPAVPGGKGPAATGKGPAAPGKGPAAPGKGPAAPGKGPAVPGKGPAAPAGKGPAAPGGKGPGLPGAGKGPGKGPGKGKGKKGGATAAFQPAYRGNPKFGRRWHWKPLPVVIDENSTEIRCVWEEIRKERFSTASLINKEKLEEFFAVAKPLPPTQKKEATATKEKQGVLDSKRLQEVGIGVARLADDDIDNALKILNGDASSDGCLDGFTEEHFERILVCSPSEAESTLLLAVEKESGTKKLVKAEVKLLPFCKIPQLQPRLRVLGFLKTKPWTPMLAKAKCLNDMAAALTNSKAVKKFLKLLLALGNYINMSLDVEDSEKWYKEKGNQVVWGISIDSLQKLTEFKGNNDKNLLHGVVACDSKVLADMKSDLNEAFAEMWVKKLSRPTFQDMLADATSFQKEYDFVKNFVTLKNSQKGTEQELNIYHSPLFLKGRERCDGIFGEAEKLDYSLRMNVANLAGYLGLFGSNIADLKKIVGNIGSKDRATVVKNASDASSTSSALLAVVAVPTVQGSAMSSDNKPLPPIKAPQPKQLTDASDQLNSVFQIFYDVAFTAADKIAKEIKEEETKKLRESQALNIRAAVGSAKRETSVDGDGRDGNNRRRSASRVRISSATAGSLGTPREPAASQTLDPSALSSMKHSNGRAAFRTTVSSPVRRAHDKPDDKKSDNGNSSGGFLNSLFGQGKADEPGANKNTESEPLRNSSSSTTSASRTNSTGVKPAGRASRAFANANALANGQSSTAEKKLEPANKASTITVGSVAAEGAVGGPGEKPRTSTSSVSTVLTDASPQRRGRETRTSSVDLSNNPKLARSSSSLRFDPAKRASMTERRKGRSGSMDMGNDTGAARSSDAVRAEEKDVSRQVSKSSSGGSDTRNVGAGGVARGAATSTSMASSATPGNNPIKNNGVLADVKPAQQNQMQEQVSEKSSNSGTTEQTEQKPAKKGFFAKYFTKKAKK